MESHAAELRIRLRHLRTFLEVARERGVGRAAGTLHVSQPAVTKTVRELEGLLGAPLFTGRGGACGSRRRGRCCCPMPGRR